MRPTGRRRWFWFFWRNSLIVTLGCVLLTLVVALGSAFSVARLRWKGRRSFILMIFIAQVAPWEALLIPILIIARDTSMLDRLATLTLIYFMPTLPFTIVTLRSFLTGIPVELEEAAQVDGCSHSGLLLAASGFLLLATTPGAGQPIGMIILGLGSGIVMTIGANAVVSTAPENRTADAGAIQESAFALVASMHLLGTTRNRHS